MSELLNILSYQYIYLCGLSVVEELLNLRDDDAIEPDLFAHTKQAKSQNTKV